MFAPKLGEQPATPWTWCRYGLKVGGKLAIRVVAASVEGALLLAYSLDKLAPALRAVNPEFDLKRQEKCALSVANP